MSSSRYKTSLLIWHLRLHPGSDFGMRHRASVYIVSPHSNDLEHDHRSLTHHSLFFIFYAEWRLGYNCVLDDNFQNLICLCFPISQIFHVILFFGLILAHLLSFSIFGVPKAGLDVMKKINKAREQKMEQNRDNYII